MNPPELKAPQLAMKEIMHVGGARSPLETLATNIAKEATAGNLTKANELGIEQGRETKNFKVSQNIEDMGGTKGADGKRQRAGDEITRHNKAESLQNLNRKYAESGYTSLTNSEKNDLVASVKKQLEKRDDVQEVIRNNPGYNLTGRIVEWLKDPRVQLAAELESQKLGDFSFSTEVDEAQTKLGQAKTAESSADTAA